MGTTEVQRFGNLKYLVTYSFKWLWNLLENSKLEVFLLKRQCFTIFWPPVLPPEFSVSRWDLFFSGAGGSTLFGSCPFFYLFWIYFHPQIWALSILQTHTSLISAKLSLIILDSYVNFLFLPCHDSIFFQKIGYTVWDLLIKLIFFFLY